MRVIATGFSPFKGLANNPSEVIVELLADCAPTRILKEGSNLGLAEKSSIFRVSEAGVVRGLNILFNTECHRHLDEVVKHPNEQPIEVIIDEAVHGDREDVSGMPNIFYIRNCASSDRTFYLHFGVDTSCDGFKIERCAYNSEEITGCLID